MFLLAAACAAQGLFEAARGAPGGPFVLRPRASSVLIDAGLAAEDAGDYAAAERTLLDAARIDHQYQPAWTLANFYFRRGDAARFWPWARHAAQMSYDDLPPLLRLCDELEPYPPAVLERIGDPPRMHRAYLDYLAGRGRWEAAQEVARRMGADPDSAAQLAAFTRLRAAATIRNLHNVP